MVEIGSEADFSGSSWIHRLSIRTKLFLCMLIASSLVSVLGAYLIITKKNILPSLALFLLVPPVISLFISRKASNSLIEMIDVAKKMADGDYNLRVAARTDDEIGELAKALNRMAKALGKRIETAENAMIIDRLTGLYNYRYFYKRFSEEIERARNYNHALTLMIIDIDSFSQFNQVNGYEAGDTVLQDIAMLIKHSIGGIGAVARYSGEQFAVILPEISKEDAVRLAKIIKIAIDSHQFDIKDSISTPLTVSIGIATSSEYVQNAEELIAIAFIELEEAKMSNYAKLDKRA